MPGGYGQEVLMEDGETLGSVCTGALLCGAAGLLKGRRVTTHWSAMHTAAVLRRDPCQGTGSRRRRMGLRHGRYGGH